MQEIAIVSKNKLLARLVELEVISAGASPTVLEGVPKNVADYSILVLDSDTEALSTPLGDCELITVTSSLQSGGDRVNTLRYPFLLGELRALISGNSPQGGKPGNSTSARNAATIYADREKRTVEISGIRVSLSEYEFRVLARLCEASGRAVSRSELEALFDGTVGGNMADVYICHLRKKLSAACDTKVIHTVRGAGYMTNYKMI